PDDPRAPALCDRAAAAGPPVGSRLLGERPAGTAQVSAGACQSGSLSCERDDRSVKRTCEPPREGWVKRAVAPRVVVMGSHLLLFFESGIVATIAISLGLIVRIVAGER